MISELSSHLNSGFVIILLFDKIIIINIILIISVYLCINNIMCIILQYDIVPQC